MAQMGINNLTELWRGRQTPGKGAGGRGLVVRRTRSEGTAQDLNRRNGYDFQDV